MIVQKILRKLKRKNTVQFLRQNGCIIGEDCEIYPSANFGSEPYLIRIGNHVRVNSGVQLVTHDGGVWVLRKMNYESASEKIDKFGQIEIGNNVHIGTNAIIMPGVKIGNNCVIGCGAVVTKSIQDGSVAVGVPARVVETIEEYYEKNKNQFDYTKQMSREEKKAYLQKKYSL